MADFFTSDMHIGHKKIRQFCPTRLDDDEMIKLWNRTVSPNDDVYHLGDLTFTNSKETIDYLSQLNFRTFYTLEGNHDNSNGLRRFLLPVFKDRMRIIDTPYLERRFDGMFVVMHHYPQYVWNRSHHGSIHLHGHCHGNFDPRGKGKLVDVGIDSPWITGKPENRPYSWKEIKDYMATVPIYNADHHEAKEPRYVQ